MINLVTLVGLILTDQFKAKLHLSYKAIESKEDVEKVFNDTRELTWKHTVKAQFIDECNRKTK